MVDMSYLDDEQDLADAWDNPDGPIERTRLASRSIVFAVLLVLFSAQVSYTYNAYTKPQTPAAKVKVQLPKNFDRAELGKWNLHYFSAKETELFYGLLASGNTKARPYLRQMATSVEVYLVDQADINCRMDNASCLVSQSNRSQTTWDYNIFWTYADPAFHSS
jgi:hypothetical protein